MHIAVVIPAYNEAGRIGSVLQDVEASIKGHQVSLVAIDDGSRDRTYQEMRALRASLPNLYVLRHRTNLGKGAAAKTGCDAACYLGADLIILMDGDGQHKGEDIDRILQPILEQGEGMVIGARERRNAMPLTMRFGNAVLTTTVRLLFNIRVLDTQSGFRAFRRVDYPRLRWASANYAMETEMLILAAASRIPVHEVDIPTVYLDNHKGTTVLDGFRILRTLLKWRFFLHHELNGLEDFSPEQV